MFAQIYANSNLNQKYVLGLVAKFSETGFVANKEINNFRVLAEITHI